jgi:alcohol dehydrogenase class IV
MPVKTFFGRNSIGKNSGELALLGRKALIVTGRTSAEKNGSLDDMKKALESEIIEYSHYSRIMPNPSVENVREAASEARKNKADFIIGIGGGSPLDAAKAAAILATNDIDDDTLFGGVFPNRPLRVAAVPTTAGTGSEVTPYSILTFNKISNKKSIGSELLFPAVAFLDPAYTETLSSETTVNTAVDAMSHSIEGYLSARSTRIIRPYAMESLEIIGRCIPELKDKKLNYETREKLLYASMLAGIVIAHTGTTVVHAMGYPLTFYKNIDHGKANGLLLYGYLKFAEVSAEGIRDVMKAMGMKNINEFGAVLAELLGGPVKLSEEEISLFTRTSSVSKNLANTVPQPREDDIRKIFTDSSIR